MTNKIFSYSSHLFLLIFTALFINGCGDGNSQQGQRSAPPTPVEVTQVKEQKVTDDFNAVGTIEATEEITVVSEISASVVGLPFEEGNHLTKGDLIAQLDDSQLAAEVNRTEALYTQRQANYNRVKSIVEQNAGSQQDLDDAFAALKVAEANLELAKARLAKTQIKAPFSGMVGARKVSVGTYLRAGDAITELANLNQIRIKFSAPERYLSQLEKGAVVNVSSPVYPGHVVKGNIIAIEPVIDSDTRSARIVAKVPNPGQKFRPGMSANVSAVLSQRPNALTIPTEAIFANGDQSFVFVVNPDSTVKRVPVTTGLQLADVVEITTGLKPGMEIIKAGHQKLFEGAKVMPVNSQQGNSKK